MDYFHRDALGTSFEISMPLEPAPFPLYLYTKLYEAIRPVDSPSSVDEATWAEKKANDIAVPMPENWPSTPFCEYPAQSRSDGPEIPEEYGPPQTIM